MNGIGSRIKYCRNLLNLTQKQFAEKLNIHRSVISMWEKESRIPDVKNCNKIAQLASVEINWLINGEGTTPIINYSGIQTDKIGNKATQTDKEFLVNLSPEEKEIINLIRLTNTKTEIKNILNYRLKLHESLLHFIEIKI